MSPATLAPSSCIEPRYGSYSANYSVEEAASFLRTTPGEVQHLIRLGVLSEQRDGEMCGVSPTSLRHYRKMCEREQRSGLTTFFDQLREDGLYDTED